MKRRTLLHTAAAGLIPLPPAYAQDRVIRIIVAFAPGGSGDLIPRIFAPVIGEILAQPVVVENRSGAGGAIGATYVARSQPDGLTLGIANLSTHGIGPAVMKKPAYDPINDFVPISNLARVPNVISIHPSVPAHSLQEFIQLARSPGSDLSFASPGIGSLGHMMGELFNQATGARMVHVPYRGAGPALQDTLSGQVKVLCDNLPASLPHIQAKKLRALAVAWPERITMIPDVPTFAEERLAVLNDPAWFGLVAPAGTPAAIIQKVQSAVAQAATRPAVRARIQELGAVPLGSTSEEFAKAISSELGKWKRVAKTGNISLEAN